MLNSRLPSRQLGTGAAPAALLMLLLAGCAQQGRATGPVVPVPGTQGVVAVAAPQAPAPGPAPVPAPSPLPAPAPAPLPPPAPVSAEPIPVAPAEATVQPAATWSSRMEYRRIGLEQFTQGRGIEVSRMGDDRLRLRIPSTFAFTERGANPTFELRDLLGRLAASIRKDEPVFIAITSYPDTAVAADPTTLARERADNVAEVLTAGGVVATRILAGLPPSPQALSVRDKLDIWVRDASKPKAP